MPLKGHKQSKLHLQKRLLALAPFYASLKGSKHSEETKRKMSVSQKGKQYTLGHKQSPQTIEKRVAHYRGKNHWAWIENRALVASNDNKDTVEYRAWRLAVYRRDGFKCKILNPDCAGRIEAHHILPWRDYVELRYEINNGITLCRHHHPRKEAEELRMQPLFKGLIHQLV